MKKFNTYFLPLSGQKIADIRAHTAPLVTASQCSTIPSRNMCVVCKFAPSQSWHWKSNREIQEMPQEANELWGLLASMLTVVEFNCEAGQIIKRYYNLREGIVIHTAKSKTNRLFVFLWCKIGSFKRMCGVLNCCHALGMNIYQNH